MAEACASGASPPAPPPATRILAALEWWSSARSLEKSNPFFLARRRWTVDHSLAAGDSQRQWLQACLPDGGVESATHFLAPRKRGWLLSPHGRCPSRHESRSKSTCPVTLAIRQGLPITIANP